MESKISAIVYTSNAGHTKKFAQLLGQKINIPAYELSEAKSKLSKGTSILYMGWLIAGQVKGYKAAVKKYDVKALCGVGMAAAGEQVADIKKSNAVAESIPVFSLQGGFEMAKLSGIYKIMMTTMQKTVGKALQNKKDKTPQEEEMLSVLINGKDMVSEDGLSEVLEWFYK